MKNLAELSLLIVLLTSANVKAEVTFLADAPENRYIKEDPLATQKCQTTGYTYTSCQGALVDECPYQKGFFRTCCPAGYIHQLRDCTDNISADNCHGYYKCDTRFNATLPPVIDGGEDRW